MVVVLVVCLGVGIDSTSADWNSSPTLRLLSFQIMVLTPPRSLKMTDDDLGPL